MISKLHQLLSKVSETEILEFKEAKNANGFDKLDIYFGVKLTQNQRNP